MTETRSREWTLPAGAGVAALETIVLIAVLALGDAPLAPFIIAVLAVKFPFCYQVLRRSPGALLALLLWEGAGVMAALGTSAPLALRALELGLAASAGALLVASVPLFPRVELPRR